MTPVSDKEKFDHLPALEAVKLAWIVEGNKPKWHRKMKRKVRKQMPLLGRALDRLADDRRHSNETN